MDQCTVYFLNDLALGVKYNLATNEKKQLSSGFHEYNFLVFSQTLKKTDPWQRKTRSIVCR
jgi:hypothetical protein